MIPDLAQSLGGGRLDAIRRRVLKRQRNGWVSDRARERVQRRMRPAPRSNRPIPTTEAQVLQSILGKARPWLGG